MKNENRVRYRYCNRVIRPICFRFSKLGSFSFYQPSIPGNLRREDVPHQGLLNALCHDHMQWAAASIPNPEVPVSPLLKTYYAAFIPLARAASILPAPIYLSIFYYAFGMSNPYSIYYIVYKVYCEIQFYFQH